jgi:hypothetical protein
MTKNSRNIPLPIKRAVRQRCGFGCVICGIPLYEYEHMQGWAKVKEHNENEITLLCDRHHRERTNGLLPLEKVKAANESPFNFRSGLSTSYPIHYSGTTATVSIGGNLFQSMVLNQVWKFSPIIINGISPISFRLEDEHLLFSLDAQDQAGACILRLSDNELQYSVGSAWDFQFVGRVFTIRSDFSDILLEFELAVPNQLNLLRGSLFCQGVSINITPDSMKIGNWSGSNKNCIFTGANAGIVIGCVPAGIIAAVHEPYWH